MISKSFSKVLRPIVIEDADTSSREENVAGLSSAITLVNSLKTILNAHAADAIEHAAADATNFPVAGAATNLATVLSLTGLLLTAYAAHDADAAIAIPLFHDAQTSANSLTSAVTPTTLQQAVTRLNDLKAKFNPHDADATSHDAGSQHQVATTDAAYGVANLFPVSGVLTGDSVFWAILNDGTGNVTGVSAVASDGYITFTFSADPQNDTIISYGVFRI